MERVALLRPVDLRHRAYRVVWERPLAEVEGSSDAGALEIALNALLELSKEGIDVKSGDLLEVGSWIYRMREIGMDLEPVPKSEMDISARPAALPQ